MEVILAWALAYAFVKCVGDTAVNLTALLKGRPVQVGRSRPVGGADGTDGPVRVRRSHSGRAAGTVAAVVKETLADGWRAGWANGRRAYRDGEGWRPWRQPPAQPDRPAARADGPADAGRGGTGPDRAADAPTVEPRPVGDDDVIDVTPRCWTDLDGRQRAAAVAYARAVHGRDWAELAVDQKAAAVAHVINDEHGTALSGVDVLVAQAGHDDPTWLGRPPGPTTPPPEPPAAAHDPAATAAGTSTQGDPVTTISGETTNIGNTRDYYTRLSGHVTGDIASQVELSRSYLSAAQMGDQAVMGAISRVDELARQLAAACDAVVAALDAHRLMEEAVGATPGAATTDYYRAG